MLCSPGGGFVTETLYMIADCNKADIKWLTQISINDPALVLIKSHALEIIT